jgi:hypothetical protein
VGVGTAVLAGIYFATPKETKDNIKRGFRKTTDK